MKFKFLYLLLSLLLLSACGSSTETEDIEVSNIANAIESSPSQEFKDVQNLTLTAKEVEYDTANNLNKPFFIEGSLELCDYYNYGYLNESLIYCGKLKPTNDSGVGEWYLYFKRDSFSQEYSALLEGKLDVFITAKVLEENYTTSQGNMAGVLAVQIK